MNGGLCYNVTVVHTKEATMSAVTISNDKIRAIAHLIGQSQLPVPGVMSLVSSDPQDFFQCKNSVRWEERNICLQHANFPRQ